MLRTFRYPLHPTKDQETVLGLWMHMCCELYNGALEHRIGAWTKAGVSVSMYDQFVELSAVRSADSTWTWAPAPVLRSALQRLDRAFKAFFRRCGSGEKPGFPRFRSRDRYDSFGIGRAKVAMVDRRGAVHVPKLGPVRFNAYRELKGAVRNVEIRRTAKGWWVCISCDLGASPPKIAVRSAVGIDLGLTSFLATSDGATVDAPQLLRRVEQRVADHQRVLALKKKGSKSRKKQVQVVASAHEHVRNARLDFHRKLAAKLLLMYDLVAYEDLNVRGMVRGRMAKSIHDAGWAQFIRCLQSKAEEAGRWVVPVDPRGTSQRCSACGCTVSKDLSVRVHACPCGYVEDRDVNAAKNVLALGTSVARALVAGQSP